MDLPGALSSMGLTGYEARLYVALLAGGQMSGYEAAKASGISRSNVYIALEGLLEKGGACKIDGEVVRYTAVPVDEFCRNKARAFDEALQFIRAHAPGIKSDPEAYVTINGDRNILDKMKNMIGGAQMRIYAALSANECALVKGEFEAALRRGIRVVILTSGPFELEGAEMHEAQRQPGQIRLITDSAYVLTGTLSNADTRASCLFTANGTLVTLFKEALKNEIALVKLKSEGVQGDG
jgi:sugar-specific transcriptional regulator TrmB